MNRDIVIVLGKTGFGKSWWGKCYHDMQSRVFVYDPLYSFSTQYKSPDEIYDMVVDLRDGQPFNCGLGDASDVDVLGNLAYAKYASTLILEECSTVFEKGQRNLPPWGRRICFLGRHRATTVMLISQRAVNIPIDFRSQATRIVTFQQHEDDDLGWLTGFIGKEKVKSLPFLPKFQCYDYWNGDILCYSIKSGVKQTFGIELKDDTVRYPFGSVQQQEPVAASDSNREG